MRKILIIAVGIAVVYLIIAAVVLISFIIDKSPPRTISSYRSEAKEHIDPPAVAVPDMYGSDSYGQLKLDIVSGKISDMPPELGKSREDIISDYVYDCHMLENMAAGAECIAYYYEYNDQEFRDGKYACYELEGDYRTECLDQFYFSMAETRSDRFCEMVIGEEMTEKCSHIQ